MSAHAVQLTPQGMGAIAVILLTGESSRGVLTNIAPPTQSFPSPGQTRRLQLLDPQTKSPLDDALLVCTAPDRYELHTHGGIAIVEAILTALTHAGANRLSLNEAATLHLLGTPLESELLLTLPLATTLTAAQLLTAQLHEGITAWSRHWEKKLATAPQNLWQLHNAAQWLLTRSRTLTKLLRPARLAIVGPPNAGKSTLANALLGRPVAITSDIPGTTRDWIDATTTFTHNDVAVPITLIDTAGIRTTTDPLEQLSIERTHQQSAGADLILYLFDASISFPFSGVATQRALLVANKIDIASTALPAHILRISAKQHRGLDALMSATLAKLDLASINSTEPFAFTPRQRSLVETLATTTDSHAAHHLLTSLIA